MGIVEGIADHRNIMTDTAPIIYFIEDHEVYGPVVEPLFRLIKGGSEYQLFSSVITLTEALTHPLRESRRDIVDKYKDFLLNASNFNLFLIDAVVAEKAAELRALHGIRTPDALQIAVALENGATVFVTNDKELTKVKEIEVLVIEDYL